MQQQHNQEYHSIVENACNFNELPLKQNYEPVIQIQPNAFQPPPQIENDGWTPNKNIDVKISLPENGLSGLQYLATVDQLLIKQKVDELLFFESKNKYTIMNSDGQKVFYGVEENNSCCGSIQEFEIKILDIFKNEIIHLSSPKCCQSCLFPCNKQKIEVFSPPGYFVGVVEQDWSILTPVFTIRDTENKIKLRIKGPICTYAMCDPVEFNVLSKDKTTVVGRISKQWSGLLREVFTDADFFGISFPMDLNIGMKALMLGACFLINAMFYENNSCCKSFCDSFLNNIIYSDCSNCNCHCSDCDCDCPNCDCDCDCNCDCD